MTDKVPEEETKRRRVVDAAGDALNVIYEQLQAAIAPSLSSTRDLPPMTAGDETMKRDRDMQIQSYEQMRAGKGQSRLMERRDTEPGETVGDSLERATTDMLEEGSDKRKSTKSQAGSSAPGFMSPADQEKEGIQARATVGGLTKGDTRNEQIRRIANRRAKDMARGGAAPGLTGATVDQLPKPTDPPKKVESKLSPEARAKEEAIRDYMNTLGVSREDAIAIYERNRARSDRPTG